MVLAGLAATPVAAAGTPFEHIRPSSGPVGRPRGPLAGGGRGLIYADAQLQREHFETEVKRQLLFACGEAGAEVDAAAVAASLAAPLTSMLVEIGLEALSGPCRRPPPAPDTRGGALDVEQQRIFDDKAPGCPLCTPKA